MVNIDTVYQKVLALANKEQRGYITPQEFNLLADKAQKDIINNYFHKIKTAYLKPKNQSEFSDEAEMVREKLSYIRNVQSVNILVTGNIATANLPTNTYSIATIFTPTTFNDDGSMQSTGGNELFEVDRNKLMDMLSNPLTRPTNKRPVYLRQSNSLIASGTQQRVTIEIFPSNINATSLNVDYWERPTAPNWAYIVVNQKALYNFSNAVHFVLHPSEEENLVVRILELAGVTIQKPELQQSAMTQKQITKQEQNS